VFNGKLSMRQTQKLIFSHRERREEAESFIFGMAINNNEK
jgi:hypothetical protein